MADGHAGAIGSSVRVYAPAECPRRRRKRSAAASPRIEKAIAPCEGVSGAPAVRQPHPPLFPPVSPLPPPPSPPAPPASCPTPPPSWPTPASVPLGPASAPGPVTHALFAHVCPAPQVPHATIPPHPSGAVPHVIPAGQVFAPAHPQTFGVPPPPHVFGAVHAGPHVTVPPQPSESVPQLSGDGHAVSGLQVVTATAAFAACTADVALPMTVNVVLADAGAVAAAVSVSFDGLPAATVGGLKAAVTPAGRSWTTSVIVSAVPTADVVVTV